MDSGLCPAGSPGMTRKLTLMGESQDYPSIRGCCAGLMDRDQNVVHYLFLTC